MAHGAKVIYFIRLHLLNDANDISRIGQVAIMQYHLTFISCGILVKMINPLCIDQ